VEYQSRGGWRDLRMDEGLLPDGRRKPGTLWPDTMI